MLKTVVIDKNNCSYLEDLDVFIKKNPEGCKTLNQKDRVSEWLYR